MWVAVVVVVPVVVAPIISIRFDFLKTTMDEPETPQDYAGDTTQPTDEMLAALSQNNSTHSIKTEPDSPASEFDALFSRLSEEPQNPDGWRRLISLATRSGETTKVRRAYDELLKHFPNTVSVPHIPYRWTRCDASVLRV